jgi:TPR repeat protein
MGEPDAGAGTACTESAPAEPLVVDWKSNERQALELAMKGGIAVVAYDCKSIRLLQDCHVASPVTPAYTFAGVTITEDGVQLTTADELRANLPLSAGRIEAEMKRGSSIDLAMVTVGRLGSPVPTAARADLVGGSPACDGATHYVRSAMLGAFVMETGTAGKVHAAAELFGKGVSGDSSGEKHTSNTGGVRADCSTAKPDDKVPPGQCQAVTRISLVPFHAEARPERAAEAWVACPSGLVWTGTKCATPAPDVSHACEGDDLGECAAQCEKNNGESCYKAARLKLRPGASDTEKLEALGFDQRACDGNYGFACRDLGYMFELADAGEIDPAKQADDARSALSYYEKACSSGDAEACQHAADCYEDGRLGTRNTAKTIKLTQRGCDLGYDRSCVSGLAIRIEGRYGATKDARAGLDALEKACDKANGADHCVLLGDYYRRGEVVPKRPAKALEAYERACSAYFSDACGKKGEMLARGGGVQADLGRAKTYLREACPELTWGASSGSPVACVFLGRAYENGAFGFPKDPIHALEIYEDRCQGWPGSEMCTLAAAMYERATVVRRDLDKANTLYRRACDSGNGDGAACVKAAPLVAKSDPGLAAAMYRRACLAGKDAASCTTAADLIVAVVAATSAKSFYVTACNATQLPQVCEKSTALGNRLPVAPPQPPP